MRICQIAVLILFLFGGLDAYSQVCEHQGSVEVTIQDENEKNVSGATIKFVDIPKDSGLEGSEFIENRQPWNQYIATFCQSEILSKQRLKNGDRRQYDVLVSSKGYRETKATLSIHHCTGSCLVNRGFITLVSDSAKLVTIKGKVKLSSSGYNDKGRIIRSEKAVSGAFIRFKRGAMVEFFARSDTQGNYRIAVPVGNYSVYAAEAPGCYICSEYFGNVVGDKDPTILDIQLLFHGEGRFWGFENSGSQITELKL
ncbi:MAG: hypothetical protein ABL959_12985 [Pyrinomonadaceae bacterium]